MSNLQDDFVQFIQLLLDDKKLQNWFISLGPMSENARIIELRNTAVRMAQSKEDESIIKMVTTLSKPSVYGSIRAVLLAELNNN